MAKELRAMPSSQAYPGAYAIAYRMSDMYVWVHDSGQWQAPGTWNVTRLRQCDIPLTTYGSIFLADAPSNWVMVQRLLICYYTKFQTNPELSDGLIGWEIKCFGFYEGEKWATDEYGKVNVGYISGSTGLVTTLVKAIKVLVNKAIQTKSTGAVVYYDDDNQTPILTHTPTDGETTITRTPT